MDKWGRDRTTALSWAGIVGSTPVLQALLEAGAAADHADDNGDTALLNAVKWSHADSPDDSYLTVVRLLMEHGVDSKKQNEQGESPQSVMVSRLAAEQDESLAQLAEILQLSKVEAE